MNIAFMVFFFPLYSVRFWFFNKMFRLFCLQKRKRKEEASHSPTSLYFEVKLQSANNYD